MADTSTSLIQPFRRNLDIDPVIFAVGDTPTATPVPSMTGKAVTTFKISNPNPFAVWYRGWTGQASDMPTIRDKGHYLLPGQVDVCRTQMPNFVAAQAANEIAFPIYDASGNYLYSGQATRLIMIYGSGS